MTKVNKCQLYWQRPTNSSPDVRISFVDDNKHNSPEFYKNVKGRDNISGVNNI